MKLFIQSGSKSRVKLQTLEGLSCLSQDEMMDWSGGYGARSGGGSKPGGGVQGGSSKPSGPSIGGTNGGKMTLVNPGHGSSCNSGCHKPSINNNDYGSSGGTLICGHTRMQHYQNGGSYHATSCGQIFGPIG